MQIKYRAIFTATLALTCGTFAFARWSGLPAKNVDFAFGPTSKSSDRNSVGIVDLPGPSEDQDSEPEVAGGVANGFTISGICDVKIWITDKDGNKITDSSGNPPFGSGSLKTSHSPGSSLAPASFAFSNGGVATYNLATGIPKGQVGKFSLQIGHFAEPSPWYLNMASSDAKVTSGAIKHYENVGDATPRSAAASTLLDVSPGSGRTGTTMTVVNGDSTYTITSLTVVLITNGSATIVGGTVEDLTGNSIPGASISVSPNGLSMEISNLSIGNPGAAKIWIDTSTSVGEDSAFRVTAAY